MVERYQQIHGGKDVRIKTVDKTRIKADGETVGYVLRVQADGSVDFEPVVEILDDLGDVEITSPSEGDRLSYDEVAGKWVNKGMIYVSEFRSYLLEN